MLQAMLHEVITIPASGRAEKLDSRLISLGGRARKARYEGMDLDDLKAHIRVIESKVSRRRKVLRIGEESRDKEYCIASTELGVASAVLEFRAADAEARPLVSGMTYYRNVKRDGASVSGERCAYLEGRPASWSRFSTPLAVAKAMEVMRHGSDDDFRKIRYVMADGKFGANHVSAIAESSASALAEIEKFCDERWDGLWPWEADAPAKLRKIMAEEAKMRMDRLAEERKNFDAFIMSLNETEVDKSEVIIDGREISDKIAGMIEGLGRISAEIMTSFKDQIRTHFGPEASNALNQVFSDKVSTAVDALSDLRDAIGSKLDDLENGGGGGASIPGADPLGDQAAAPADGSMPEIGDGGGEDLGDGGGEDLDGLDDDAGTEREKK